MSANSAHGIRIVTSSSERKGKVGMGEAIQDTVGNVSNREPVKYSVPLGMRTEQNPYMAELAAIAMAVRCLPPQLIGRHITICTSNRAAILAISRPEHQSGQSSIKEIYKAIRMLRDLGNRFLIVWVPSQGDFELGRKAKEAARQATEQGRSPREQSRQAKSTAINTARAMQERERTIPEGIGKYSRGMDAALPGKHTRTLYDAFKRREASILAQLRTGRARLNGYLYRIGAAESDQCACGEATETTKHFLFRCTRWDAYRTQMLEQTDTRRGSLSFYLGGKASSDLEPWATSMEAVQATVKYAMATGRLDAEIEPQMNHSQL